VHKGSFHDPVNRKHYSFDEVEDRSHKIVDGKPLDPKSDNLGRLSQGDWYAKGTNVRLETKLDKMSKSRYNVVNPDDMCAEYGADAMRLYELYMGPLESGVEWETTGVVGMRRFLDRVWRLLVDPETDTLATKVRDDAPEDNKELERALHQAIKRVTHAVTSLEFNTAIADMISFVNEATKPTTTSI